MDRRRIIELVIYSLWLITVIVMSYVYFQKSTNKSVLVPDNLVVVPSESEFKKFDVQKLIILRGDSFDITIKNDKNTRILGKLPVMATENAKRSVLNLLNHSTNPKVVLHEKQPDGRWTIDFFFTNDGKELNLSDWLVSNNLVYK